MNILAVGQDNYPQALDDYSFDEDSSDALSPDQPASQESQGSAASPGELKTSDSPSPITPNAATSTQVQFLNVETKSSQYVFWSGTIEMGHSFTWMNTFAVAKECLGLHFLFGSV